jgi:SNF2 family DNA or RNA helicase
MNVMMQLRKCCNHPYLIRDAEESITKDINITHARKDPEVKDEALFKVRFLCRLFIKIIF